MNGALVVLAMTLLAPATSARSEIIVDWASPTQREVFMAGPGPQCASGGFGASKTYAFCLKALRLSDAFPKNRGVIARRVAKELRATTMATFFKICPPAMYAHGHRNDQEGRLVLNNGSEILFTHFEDPERQALLKGLEINWFLIDQAEEAPEVMEEVFDILMARLSRWDKAEVPQAILDTFQRQHGKPWPYVNPATNRPIPPPYAMLTCNPDIELHWIYRRFHPDSQERREKKIPEVDLWTGEPTGRVVSYEDMGYRMFHMPSLENKFLPAANRQELLSKDSAFVKRYVRGEWGIPEGAIHVVPAESIIEGSFELLEYFRRSCTLHRFLDHGESSPTCCLWMAVDRNGNCIFYREYYLPNALISTHRANITALSEGERYEFNQADPSIFDKTSQKRGGRWAVSDEYQDSVELPAETALFWSKADNNELGTRNRINEYLRVDPERMHPFTQQKGSPKLFFVKANESYPQGCHHAIIQTRSQRRVKIGTDMGRPVFSDERDPDVTDHAMDCVRYAIASRPPEPTIYGPQAKPGTFYGEQKRLAKLLRRGVVGRRFGR